MVFNLEFSKKLIEAAESLKTNNGDLDDSGRAILYLSLLSCEISLKAFLEKANVPIGNIKKISHDLARLLKDIGEYEIEKEVIPGKKGWVRATCLRSIVVDNNYRNATVGTLLTPDLANASKYPNEIRYGDLVKHFNPIVMLNCARKVLEWVMDNYHSIKVKP